MKRFSVGPVVSWMTGEQPTGQGERQVDSTLVEEIQRTGSQHLFGILVQRYRDRVFRLVASVLGPGSDAEAEDVTQDVFLHVYGKLSRFRGASSFATWLYRIAYNRAIDRKRRARFRYPHVSEDRLAERPAAGDPYASARARAERDEVQAAVRDLSEPARTIVHLYYWMECPVAEIAEILEMKEGTVKSHLYRARQGLARRLESTDA